MSTGVFRLSNIFLDVVLVDLSDNYILYHHSFKDFLYHAGSFFRGSAVSGWNTIVYLLPLYIFCDIFGGLSLKTICLFTVTTSLISLALFYFWMRRAWGRQAALWGTLLLGSSAVFQEIARSGHYMAYSFLLVAIWLLYCFRNKETGNAWYFSILGFLTGLLWYGYGLIRGLALVAFVRVWRSKKTPKWISLVLFLSGMLAIIIPGVIIMREQHYNYHGPWRFSFIDEENILDNGKWNLHYILNILCINFIIFVHRMLGGMQRIDHWLRSQSHAHFLNPYFVVPMLIGMRRTFRSWKLPSNQLLLWLSLIIFVSPVLSSTGGYAEARRSLFYIIPIYCFIGLGCKEIFDWVKRRNAAALKWLITFLLMCIVLVALNSEMRFIQSNIIFSKRDMGILAFADKIKKAGMHGNLYYLQRDRDNDFNATYRWIVESDVMRVALMENGQSNLEVLGLTLKDLNLALHFKDFYVAKSPDISQKAFNDWAFRNKLEYDLILESALRNNFRNQLSGTAEPFKLYVVHAAAVAKSGHR